MGLILSISGCKAVGKTTLIKELKRRIPDLLVREGFRKINTGFNTLVENEYYENQKLYIKREILEFENFKKVNSPIILLRGPEDLIFYTLHYPKIYNKSWDVEKNLANELFQLRKYKSNKILYLDADLDIILKRKINDITKKRENMNQWLLNWQPYIEKYIKSLDNTEILSTNNLNSEEVLNYTINLLNSIIIKEQHND